MQLKVKSSQTRKEKKRMTLAPITPPIPIYRREFLQANHVAQKLIEFLKARRMIPAFTHFFVFQAAGMTFLVAVLDFTQIGDHGRYIDKNFLHELSTDLKGLPVYLSNSTGIRYLVLLSPLPRLPQKVDLPLDTPHGQLLLGVRFNMKSVSVDWETTPHIAVLGATGSGKSMCLQSFAIQAIRDDMKLLLCDMDQTTFGRFKNHSSLLAPIATTPQAALELIEKAIAECDRRAELFVQTPEHPQKISEYNTIARRHGKEILPRVLAILDEASATLTALGGAKGALGQALATLGWRGRKFGVHFVFGAQEFTKDMIGPIREQVGLTVCFRVRNAQMAERMGCRGTERISEKRPGLAITDCFGPIQTYYIEPSFIQPQTLVPTVNEHEAQLFLRTILETQGRLSIPILTAWGIRERAAREMLEIWEKRGWVLRDPQRDNARYITTKLREILSPNHRDASNRQTRQTASRQA